MARRQAVPNKYRSPIRLSVSPSKRASVAKHQVVKHKGKRKRKRLMLEHSRKML